jgi:Mg2+-importing ATPase
VTGEGREADGPDGDPALPLWSGSEQTWLERLRSGPAGLSEAEAARRLAELPRLPARRAETPLRAVVRQLATPIVLLLLAAATLSAFLDDPTDAVILLGIVGLSSLLGAWQEWHASDAVARLLARVRVRATLLRDGRPVEVAPEVVVPGDVILFSAGSMVPADCRVLEARDCFAVEAALSGESFPVEKLPGVVAPDTPMAQRTNCLFRGTHVASGTARALAVCVGGETEFGRVADRLRLRPPETDFERGVRRFGTFLAELTGLLVLGLFAINVYLHRPVLDSFLFALALAVGLTPQLLPAVIAVNLAHGARRMAAVRVIVKRLAAIESLGCMTVLCCDKTGTLTRGVAQVADALDAVGAPSERALQLAAVNAALQSGFENPIDAALRARLPLADAEWTKLDEVPYDFVRKRLSVLVAHGGRHLLVTKGAVAQVLEACGSAEAGGGERPLAALRERIDAVFADLTRRGLRCLGVAVRDLGTAPAASRADERDMTFAGFVVLEDPVKETAPATIARLRELGVSLRVVTGDHHLVAESVVGSLGLATPRILTGADLRRMSDEALRARVDSVDVFAEIEPNQKERILLAYRKAGHVVGFLGDGINDASALHVADVGLSVEGAVDVAQEAADVVLLESDLSVVVAGVREGRSTFANTLKYVFMATSANFGNMFSMAGASLLLPFLPLLPKQILLTNLLTDLPEMAIASDRVDADWVERPHRWNVGFIRRFMLLFGPLSSVFDFATFAVLWFVLHAGPAEFRTGWFVESVVSASLVVLVVRTRGAAWRSLPARGLALATVGVCAAAVALPVSPLAAPLGFVPLPARFYPVLAAIVVAYIGSAEAAKRRFYRWASF